ncbi:hypothetical protein NYO98_07845 [Nocardioides sp. STR2]|uniref:Dolichyl-phosphate-mannose-protein mannosyltransferase n=1 Tax=Nocardioides pini TaxID=2975053 RepID=A0ABT4CDH7_9ACTN|nr:hypothetical protein [Nocardioides pini]MCY4726189.1 hypothetical protein [Nocardioides pini]
MTTQREPLRRAVTAGAVPDRVSPPAAGGAEDPLGAGSGRRADPLLLGTCIALVLAHTAFRAWAVLGAWFQEDDFELLRVSLERPLDLDYLMTPHSGHLMPLGRLLIDLSVAGGLFNWPATAAVTIAFQAAVALACLWMLRTLFGMRWGIVAPLAVFLFSPISMPATVWWAAALNQLGQQIGLMCAITCWVMFERTGRRTWLALVLASVALALAADIRGLAIPPVLAAISYGWFETGGPVHRLRSMLRRLWWAGAVAAVIGVGTIAYYAAYVPLETMDRDWGLLGPLASSMIGTAFTTGILGGPWAWMSPQAPAAFADPPVWLAHLSWVVVAAVVGHAFLVRRRTLRAWALLAGYLVLLLVLLWSSRAPYVGPIAGAEYRYLTDAAAMTALALGLAYLPLAGAPGSSEPREAPMFTPRLPVVIPLALALVVSVSGVWSSIGYARIWHEFVAPRDYVRTLSAALDETGPVALADTGLPPDVVAPIIWSEDRLPRLVSMLSPESRFLEAGHELAVVDGDGGLDAADLHVERTTLPGGVADCGWQIDNGSSRLPLDGPVIEGDWWLRVNYLAEEASPMTVIVGSEGESVDTALRPGLNQLYVRVGAAFDSVLLLGIDPSITVCVDKVEVGRLVSGAPLT